MKTRQLVVLLALFALSFLPRAFAVPFSGTITQTITYSTAPGFDVGQTFSGQYSYDAPMIDGDFINLPDPGNPDGILASLKADLFYFHFGWGDLSTGGFIAWNELLVQDGHVTKFNKEGQKGPADFVFTETAFSYSYKYATNETVRGTMVFSDPHAVPDAESTIALLSVSLLGLGCVRRGKSRF